MQVWTTSLTASVSGCSTTVRARCGVVRQAGKVAIEIYAMAIGAIVVGQSAGIHDRNEDGVEVASQARIEFASSDAPQSPHAASLRPRHHGFRQRRVRAGAGEWSRLLGRPADFPPRRYLRDWNARLLGPWKHKCLEGELRIRVRRAGTCSPSRPVGSGTIENRTRFHLGYGSAGRLLPVPDRGDSDRAVAETCTVRFRFRRGGGGNSLLPPRLKWPIAGT